MPRPLAFRGGIEKLQFAPARRWEENLTVTPGSPPAALPEWLAGFSDGELGIEAFFQMEEKELTAPAFVGLRLPFSAETAAAAAELQALLTGCAPSAEDFCLFWERKLSLRLFDRLPDFMELGLVNLWNSFGPLKFWHGGGAPEAALAEALSADPRYLQKLSAPPAIEAGYSRPIPHWLGIIFAAPIGGGNFLLDREAANSCLKKTAFSRKTD